MRVKLLPYFVHVRDICTGAVPDFSAGPARRSR